MLLNKEEFKDAFINKLQTMCGKSIDEACNNDKYIALASVVRDCISSNWIQTNKMYRDVGEKQVYYFSIEFLMGKLLDCNLINTDLKTICSEGLKDLGINLDEILAEEPDAGLGNGGLGRLAACFLDSLAALNLPGHGCGIRYRYGLFEQKIVDNYQVELPDNWLKDGYIWEFRKADKAVEVRFGGNVCCSECSGKLNFCHENYESVKAVPYDIPIIGYKNNTVNTLRLWNAEPMQVDFDLSSFNHGDYLKAVQYKQSVERICKILYPDDSFYEGRLLRLKQQYFFVSAGLQSILRRFKRRKYSIHDLPNKVAVHINDTHPALAIPELMRLLLDEEGLGWEEAWQITTETISYTNHTILPEALEKWPVEMFKTLLPRIYMIVEEINRRFCEHLWNRYSSWDKIRAMSIIVDDQVHMARLAVVGSHSVNGVAQIHSDILKNHVMADLHDFYPYKFNNKTNGITHRRWLIKANPELAKLISSAISPKWINSPNELERLKDFATDAVFQQKIVDIRQSKKLHLAKYIKNKYDLTINTDSIFDIHIKRIHAYKRQILNALHILDLYKRLKSNPNLDITPRTFIFAGKAAPGYYIAKQTIKLINIMASLINNDKTINDKLKVVFLENYSVSLGEMLFPAADVSEQISTASKEASGTGNMKFMMNGAITIGTLDGANVEIRDAVGDDNIIIFGLKAEQVLDYYRNGGYCAWDVYNSDNRIKVALDQLVNGFFPNEKEEFRPLYDYLLLNNDEFFVLKDFASYADAHCKLEQKYNNKPEWLKMSIINIAKSGMFSSDRTINEYASGIWDVNPVIIP
ncbi:glycogen/starch/alpha-glucan phosphorylase [Dendrosporobacter sp. 1207_IL3150]|uniref:glycogen/starch/alpha-glucan phosphorylase n=1 Tax=Dendrosporobacter sp. 1207_IL3150 TaxID=3084054 RepID=UPI002FDA5BB5